jgi:hypothetical protein
MVRVVVAFSNEVELFNVVCIFKAKNKKLPKQFKKQFLEAEKLQGGWLIPFLLDPRVQARAH